MTISRTPSSAFARRRKALMQRLDAPMLLAAGAPRSRNYPAGTYPFRAASHFLYCVGASFPNAALLLADGLSTLFVVPEHPGDALWEGPRPSLAALRVVLGIDEVRSVDDLPAVLHSLPPPATVPTQDASSSAWLSGLLGRVVTPRTGASLVDGTLDARLADALVTERLVHDDAAIEQLRVAGRVSAAAHRVGMRATRDAKREAEVYGAMVGSLRRDGCGDAYGPIVTVHGEVLHNERHDGDLAAGDLLLADVGAETPEGWAGDITRVWPVSGRFSASQRAIYEIVLAAELEAIGMVRPGVRYRDIHEAAKRVIVGGLCDLGIFRGDVTGLLERGAAALFFPHGVGHLLGLDVHDMEDLGDRAGYAPGRTRATAFGDCYLRLDRDLVPGMALTIEPGFYQVPAILGDTQYTAALGDDLRRDVLQKFSDVRGIRIEDDVLVTAGDPQVLTGDVPKSVEAVEELVRGG